MLDQYSDEWLYSHKTQFVQESVALMLVFVQVRVSKVWMVRPGLRAQLAGLIKCRPVLPRGCWEWASPSPPHPIFLFLPLGFSASISSKANKEMFRRWQGGRPPKCKVCAITQIQVAPLKIALIHQLMIYKRWQKGPWKVRMKNI